MEIKIIASIVAAVATLVAIIFIILYVNANTKLQTSIVDSEKQQSKCKADSEKLDSDYKILKSEFEKIKTELSNTLIDFVKYKNDPQRTEGATRVILNLLLLETFLTNFIYRNPSVRVGGNISADFLPELKQEIEAMGKFNSTFTSSEEFKSMLKTFGVTTQDEFKQMMVKRIDGFTSLDISGFLKKNNITWN